jgi:hypothetical protein
MHHPHDHADHRDVTRQRGMIMAGAALPAEFSQVVGRFLGDISWPKEITKKKSRSMEILS